MQSADLIETAKDLLETAGDGNPMDSNLRRAVSTMYYALFHCLAECCADLIAGPEIAEHRRRAWRQTYRALEHSTVRRRCEHKAMMQRFPNEIQAFAALFIEMQAKRHNADYDPDSAFLKSDVIADISKVEIAMKDFNDADELDRHSFAIYVLLNTLRG